MDWSSLSPTCRFIGEAYKGARCPVHGAHDDHVHGRIGRASLEAEHVRGTDKIGRRGRTPTVVPQAYRSQRRWEKNSAVNKMVLTLDIERGARRGDRLRLGLSLSLALRARRRDRAAPSLLLATSRLHPTLSIWLTSLILRRSHVCSPPLVYPGRRKTFLPFSDPAYTFRVFV